jgi:hypothetical protein
MSLPKIYPFSDMASPGFKGSSLIPAEPGRAACPKHRSSNANGLCGQKRLDPRKSCATFKGIFCYDISESESYMPSHAVVLSQVRSPAIVMHPLVYRPNTMPVWPGSSLFSAPSTAVLAADR